MDIVGTIAAVGSALGVVKELKEIDAQYDQAALKLKIADLTTALADAKLGLVDVAEQLKAKDGEISDLKAKLRYRAENLVEHNGFRYQSNGGKADGLPFCPVCEAKGVYLKVVQVLNAPGQPFCCPSCKANYGRYGVYLKAGQEA